MASVYGGSIGVLALGLVAGALSPALWIAAASMVVVGFGNGIAVVCNALLVQRGAPDELRGRAFTIIMSTNYAVLGVSMAAGRARHRRDRRAVGRGRSPPRSPRWPRCSGYVLAPARGRGRAARAHAGARSLMARSWTQDELAAGVREGDRRTLARAISLVEDGDPARIRARARAVRRDRSRVHDRPDRAAGRGEVDARERARAPRARVGADRGRHLRRPVEPVLAGRAARRPHPPDGALPRPGACSSARWARAATWAGWPRRRCRRC